MDPVCAAHFQELILLAFPAIVELDLPENISLNGIMCERKKSLVRGSSRDSGLNTTLLFLSGSVLVGGLVLLGRQISEDPCKKPVASRPVEKYQPKSVPETVTQNFGSSNRAPGKFKVVPLAPKPTASNEGSPDLPKAENEKFVVLKEASSSDSNAVPKLAKPSAPNEASSATNYNESTNSISYWDQCWDIDLNALGGKKWMEPLPDKDFIERWGKGELWTRHFDVDKQVMSEIDEKIPETISKIGFYINPGVWKEGENGENFYYKGNWTEGENGENGEKEFLKTLRSSLKEKPKHSERLELFSHNVGIVFEGIEVQYWYESRFWLPPLIFAVFQSKLAASSHETWKSLPEETRRKFGEKICQSSARFIANLLKDLEPRSDVIGRVCT